jgi:prepilin-type N-terminal cleavage/methylation domain-containing protein
MKPAKLSRLAGFTLVEMLTVIAIIAILAGLILSAFSGVMKSAARTRARSEIAAMSAALQSYQSDNGIFPPSGGFSAQSDYLSDAPPSPKYQAASQALYQALTGQTTLYTLPPAGTKIYMTFKTSQLGNYQAGAQTYIQDPFGNPYGYFTGNPTVGGNAAQLPYNGANQFDLWSTGGDISGSTNSWISNWGMGS